MISRDIITTPIISPPLQRGLSGLAMPMLLIGFLASIPLVVVHSLNLWGTPYAKAFFLAYLGITLYLWNEGMARTEVPRWRYRLAWFSLISSAIVGILSFLLYAPYLGQVAFLLAFLALLSSQFTTIPLHRMLKLMLLASFLAIPSRVLTVLESEFTKNSLGLVSSGARLS